MARAVGLLLLLALAWALLCGFRLNLSPSVPVGLYRLATLTLPLHVGALVAVQTPDTRRVMMLAHGFLASLVPLLKPVAGLPGDTVCRRNSTLLINGQVYGRVAATTHAGVPLPSALPEGGCRTLAAGDVWLASPTDTSLDSRYFSAVPITALHTMALPILTWR